MKKKILTFAIAAAMVLTCFAPVTAFAAGETYTGTLPELQNAIDKTARSLAWPYGTADSEKAYSTGAPTAEFKKAFDSVYPDRSKWSAAPKAGASCDVFVGTVVRASGYDKGAPRGLTEQVTYYPNSSKFTRLSISKVSEFEPGDIIIYKKSDGSGHVNIYVEVGGVGYFAEAHLGKWYGSLYRKAKDQNPSACATYGVYRANQRCVAGYSRGDNCTQIKYLQQFLNWAGFNCDTPDGGYGPKTELAVRQFQAAVGLTPDGKFGSQSLEAARTYQKGQAPVSTYTPENTTVSQPTSAPVSAPAKVAYTGKYPSKTIKKNRGSKTNVKRWQAFLRWYGYPMTTGGKFGNSTVTYTKAFQRSVGIKADGIVGKTTIKKAKAVRK